MSDTRKLPAELLFYLVFGLFGLAVMAACLAGEAQLMAVQGISSGLAAPLATVAVCIGNLCSGWAAAFRRRERGLLTGLLQSAWFIALLSISALLNHAADGPLLPVRILAVALCGCIGGVLGVAFREKRRIPH